MIRKLGILMCYQYSKKDYLPSTVSDYFRVIKYFRKNNFEDIIIISDLKDIKDFDSFTDFLMNFENNNYDEIFFYFSGHGQKNNLKDRYKMLNIKYIKDNLAQKSKTNAKLIMVIDCCSIKFITFLPFIFSDQENIWKGNQHVSEFYNLENKLINSEREILFFISSVGNSLATPKGSVFTVNFFNTLDIDNSIKNLITKSSYYSSEHQQKTRAYSNYSYFNKKII